LHLSKHNKTSTHCKGSINNQKPELPKEHIEVKILKNTMTPKQHIKGVNITYVCSSGSLARGRANSWFSVPH